MHIRLGGSLGLPRNPILLVAALAVLLLPGYLLTAAKLTDHDCFIMGAVAQRVLAGERLYEGTWDNKPPLALLWAAVPPAIAPGSYTALGLRSPPPTTKLLRIAAMAVGGLAAWAMLVAAPSPIMSLPGYVQTVFLAPRQYRGHYWEAVTLLSAVRNDAAGMVIFAASALLVGAGPRPWPAAATAPAPAGSASPAAGPAASGGRWFFAAVIGAAGAAVFAPMRPFLHYWEQIAPALVLMVPAALAVFAPRPRRFATAIAGLFLAANAAFTVAYLGLVRTPLSDEHVLRERMDDVAGLIRRVSAPGDSLPAVGRQSAYRAFAAGLRPATTFFWDGFWDRLVPLSGRTVEAAGGELRAAPPAILALPADGEAPPATLAGSSLGPIVREWLSDGRYEEWAPRTAGGS